MSIKEFDHDKEKKHKHFTKILWGFITFLFIVLVTILIICAILNPSQKGFKKMSVIAKMIAPRNATIITSKIARVRPLPLPLFKSKPSFILQDVTVYAFNATVPNLLTSNFQVTISSHNPNDIIGIYYDRLDVYVTYRSQQVTYRTAIPPSYQGHKEVDVWSPFVYGVNIPLTPSNFAALLQDQTNGNVLVDVKVDGRFRWKVGAFISGHNHLSVSCPAYIAFGSKSTGASFGDNGAGDVKFQLVQRCTVNV